ncbi:hypothetical protein D3C78_1513910 [compost metagenome]
MFVQAAQAERGIQGNDLEQPAEQRQLRQQPGQQGQRQHRQAPGAHPVAAPAAAVAVETGLQDIGQTAEGHERVVAARFAERHIQRHAGEQANPQAHGCLPQ